MSFTKFIKKADLFGFPIQLMYEGDNIKQRTPFGGTLTILLIMMTGAWLGYGLDRLNNP